MPKKTPAKKAAPKKTASKSSTNARPVLQFKVTLLEVEPPIWRRIQIQEGTLADLHELIQASFGWQNCHLHQFTIAGEYFAPLPPDDLRFDLGRETHDEAAAPLAALLAGSPRKAGWLYEYDFGDSWRHEVRFEGHVPRDPKSKYPLCVDGERACPPEDIGGPWGFADFLDAIADPNHERHDELLDWCGPYNPLKFDPKAATRAMRKVV